MNELDLFTQALNITNPAERAEFLDQACAGNPELRRRLEDLLAGHDLSTSPLDQPPVMADNLTMSVISDAEAPTAKETSPTLPRASKFPSAEGIGAVISGRYTLAEVIGEGGMGSVYLASQTDPVQAPAAPIAMQAAICRPVMIPPAASTGTLPWTARRTSGTTTMVETSPQCPDLANRMLAGANQRGARDAVLTGAGQHGSWRDAQSVGDQPDRVTEGDVHQTFTGFKLIGRRPIGVFPFVHAFGWIDPVAPQQIVREIPMLGGHLSDQFTLGGAGFGAECQILRDQ